MIRRPLIGELRDRIALDKEVKTADGQGGYSIAWVTQYTVWGKYIPSVRKNLTEVYDSGKMQPVTRGRIFVRKKSAPLVTSQWTAVIEGERLNIRSVTEPDRSGQFWEMEVDGGEIAN